MSEQTVNTETERSVGQKKKINITPEQVKKACDAMGKTANSVDNLYDNIKYKLGPLGPAVGFGVLLTLMITLIAHPGFLAVLFLFVCVGCAPMIREKLIEVRSEAERLKPKKGPDSGTDVSK